MAVHTAPFYWYVCDECGARQNADDSIVAWSDQGGAAESALDSGWSIEGDLALCHTCGPFCERCGKPAGPLSGERDYHCVECWVLIGEGD